MVSVDTPFKKFDSDPYEVAPQKDLVIYKGPDHQFTKIDNMYSKF